MDRNWNERAYREEMWRERARIKVKEETEKPKTKAKRGLSGYIVYIAVIAVCAGFLHYLGNIFGINLGSALDTNFLLPVLIILVLFIGIIKGWI